MEPVDRRAFLAAAGVAIAAEATAAETKSSQDRTAPADKLGIGCVGVGGRGTALLETVLTVPGIEIRAICDIKPEHLERAQNIVAKKTGRKPLGTPDWKKLLDMPGVDAVISALPCDLHAANYLDVISAGKDLYGEKPMCLSLADCDKVIKATRDHDRIVQIGFQRRADPRFIESMKEIHEGHLGPLVEGRILWSNSWGPLYDWFGKRERSGDWMVEQAVHGWDVMNWAIGATPLKAVGLGRNDLFRDKQPDRNVHDYYSAVLEYPKSVFVSIVHSWISPTKLGDEYTRLIGMRGGIDFNTGVISYRPELKQKDRFAWQGGRKIESTQLALASWVNSVRNRTQPVATVEGGRDAVLTALLVRDAVDKGRAVEASEVA